MSDHDAQDGRRTTAIILLAVAGYIILANTGLMDFFGISNIIGWVIRTAFSLVPAAILALGVFWIIKTKDGQKPVIGWIVAVIGLVFLVSQTELFGLSFGNMFLPMWLVIVAVVLMNPRDLLPRRMNMLSEELEGDNKGLIQLVAFMGGYKLDFTESDMEADSMELNLFCVMGGVEILVPPNWDVEKRGAVCIMGGFSNKTTCMAEELELPRKTLIIKGFALMGGGEIRN